MSLILAIVMTVMACAQDCSLSPEAESKLLALPYADFDQSMGGGWRSYAEKHCYRLSAKILDRYEAKHRNQLVAWQRRAMIWHSGQMYAFDGDIALAKVRFQDSLDPNEPADSPILWNDYVQATLAFLNRDRQKLRHHRDRIAQGPDFNGTKTNLDVVDSLLRCFDQPYSVAYSGCPGSSAGGRRDGARPTSAPRPPQAARCNREGKGGT